MQLGDPVLLLAIAATVAGAVAIYMGLKKPVAKTFGDFGSGLLGIATTIALIGGAWLYVLEGRNRPKIDVTADATVVPLAPGADGTGRVLIHFVGTVTNSGAFGQNFDCTALDALGFPASGEIARNQRFGFDLEPEPLLQEAATGEDWRRCLDVERERWNIREQERIERVEGNAEPARPFGVPPSGFRYASFALEPGESRTKGFELIVPCTYAAVRFTFVVPKTDTTSVNELKLVRSIATECAESRQQASARPMETRPRTSS